MQTADGLLFSHAHLTHSRGQFLAYRPVHETPNKLRAAAAAGAEGVGYGGSRGDENCPCLRIIQGGSHQYVEQEGMRTCSFAQIHCSTALSNTESLGFAALCALHSAVPPSVITQHGVAYGMRQVCKNVQPFTACTVHHERRPVAHLTTTFDRHPPPSKQMFEVVMRNQERIIASCRTTQTG